MYILAVILTSVFIGIFVIKLVTSEQDETNFQVTENEWQNLNSSLDVIWHYYFLPLKRFIEGGCNTVCTQFSFFELTIFTIKYVPTGIYMYKFIKSIYKSCLERIKQKQLEIEELQLQIEIVDAKLCVRDAEFTERLEHVRAEEERLRGMRAKVRAAVAARHDQTRVFDVGDAHHDQFILELIKDMKYEQILGPQNVSNKVGSTKLRMGEHAQTEPNTPENEESVYSSLSDGDIKKDCVVKIVKVTNVFKVALLKHLIKQRKLRRVSRQKKYNTLKTLLEGWHRSLHLAINHKMNLLNCDLNNLDVASHEAMGDFAKHSFPDLDDSSRCDGYCDDYSTSNYEQDVPDAPASAVYEQPTTQLYYKNPISFHRDCDLTKDNRLDFIPEETSSHIDMADECPGNTEYQSDRKINLTHPTSYFE